MHVCLCLHAFPCVQARNNANKVFVFAGAYVAATCGVMHGLKVAAKRLAHRLPR